MVTGLDIGPSRIAVAVGVCSSRGGFEMHGAGLTDTRGIGRHAIVDPSALTRAIAAAVTAAERTAGFEIASAHLGFSGPLGCFRGRGVIRTGRLIQRDDEHRAFGEAVRDVAVPDGHEVLQIIAQDFSLDGQDGIASPAGLTAGSPLEARACVVTYDAGYGTVLKDCVRRSGLAVLSTRASLLAASEAVLTADELELGVAVVDLGAETTTLALFERGWILDMRTFDLGAVHLAGALAGHADLLLEEFCQKVRTVIGAEEGALNAGLVFIGASAQIPAVIAAAARLFDRPVRCGRPALTGRLATSIDAALFAAAVGLTRRVERHVGRPRGVPRLAPGPESWTG